MKFFKSRISSYSPLVTWLFVCCLLFPLFIYGQNQIEDSSKSTPCSQYQNYRSLKSDSISKIRFINQTNAKVKIYWLNHLGEKILFRTLDSKSEAVQQTYLSHAWLLTWENEECIKVVIAQTSKQQDAIINETPPQSLSENQQAVINDRAANAFHLKTDGDFYLSNTSHCTLQEECLNRKLAAKYIVYHNDQWFTFTSTESDVHYISVRNQNCRDVKGVQVIVFDGTICQPSSYELIKAVSFATQDDIYIKLENLKKNHTYIINLDGYLEDHCSFEIGVSTTLPDFHLWDDHQIKVNPKIYNDSIRLEWKLTEELQELGVMEFEIQRRFESEKKFTKIGERFVGRLVTGTYQNEYAYTDTVHREGYYHYKLVGIGDHGKKYLLNEYSFKAAPTVHAPNKIYPQLDIKEKSVITVEIYDWYHNTIITSYNTSYTPGTFSIDLDSYFSSSRLRLKVVIKDSKGKTLKEQVVNKE